MSWQYSTKSTKDKLLHLMSSKEMTDITVEVGREKQSFSTHTFLMSINSEVFHSMFHGPLQKKTKHISLPEDSVEAFQVFFKYIYTDTVILNSVEEAISSLYFGEKYMVKCMKEESVSYLKNNITLESALNISEVAALHQETDLENKCWKYIVENTSEILKQDCIKYTSFATMLNIVSTEQLTLDRELDIYKAIVKWGKQNYQDHTSPNLYEKLKPLLNQIRFQNMNPSEFIEDPCKDGILPKDEQIKILIEICKSRNWRYDGIEVHWRKSRQPFALLTDPLYEYSNYKSLHKYTNNVFPVIFDHFQVNQNLFISAISFGIRYHQVLSSNTAIKLNYSIKLKITNLKNGTCTDFNTDVIINTYYKEIVLRIKDPVYVQRNEIFEIELRFLSPFKYEFTNCPNCSSNKLFSRLCKHFAIDSHLISFHYIIEDKETEGTFFLGK